MTHCRSVRLVHPRPYYAKNKDTKGLISIQTKSFFHAVWQEVRDDDKYMNLTDEQIKQAETEFANLVGASRVYLFRVESKEMKPSEKSKKKKEGAK